MRYLVIGDSITNPGLSADERPWSALLPPLLEARGVTPVDLEAFLFWPVGQRSAAYALKRADDYQPDVVLVVLNAYPCVVKLVSERVRRLFGAKAHRWFTRAEHTLQARAAARPGRAGRTTRLAKRAARRTIGATGVASASEVSRVYCEVLHGLARLEGVAVYVLGAARFGSTIREANPGIEKDINSFQAPMRRAAAEHRMPFIDLEPVIRPEGDAAWMPDHVHLSPLGNRIYAATIAAAVAP